MRLIFASLVFFFSINAHTKPVSLLTYNTGLAHGFVAYAKERLPFISYNLQKQNSDILCLQEVWSKKDRKRIYKDLKKKYPYSFITKVKNKKSKKLPTCKVKEIFGEGKFVSCMKKNCSEQSGDDFTNCVLNTCGPVLIDLKKSNRECATSLMAQVGKSTIAGLFTILNPLKRAGIFSYKGSNGLMLFSKYPLENKDIIDFSDISTLNRRQALSAEFKVNGKRRKVVCTHITANLEATVPYTGTFPTWELEGRAQIQRIINKVEQTELPTYLLGDFNCSEEDVAAGVASEASANCKLLSNRYFNALVELNNECTFCNTNMLNDTADNSTNLDHVFVKNSTVLSAKLKFKQKVTIPLKKDQTIITNLSDHYGVEVLVE